MYNSLLRQHFLVQKGMYFDYDLTWEKWHFLMSSIIEDGFWNYAILPETCDITRDLSSVESIFNNTDRVPSVYIIDEEKCPNITELLKMEGYEKMAEESFMTYCCNDCAKPNVGGKIIIRRAVDGDNMKDFIDVFTNAYGGEKTPDQPYGELDKTYMDALIRSFKNTDKFYHFVCYVDGNPVSVASLCYENGKGGIYNVGTRLNERGCGYGTAATMACIEKWNELNGDILFLQTETGSNVEAWYYTLGFKLEFHGSTYCKE